MSRKTLLAAAVMAGAMAANAPTALAVDSAKFEVVGTWGFLENWKQFEKKFWTEDLPKASGGKLTANAKPYTELGLKGYEVMQGLKKGAYDVVHALTSYSAQASPALEGIDLAGVVHHRREVEAAGGGLGDGRLGGRVDQGAEGGFALLPGVEHVVLQADHAYSGAAVCRGEPT